MKTIHVLAVITAKKGKRENVLEIFRQNAPIVHQEPGCIEYVATVDADNAGALQTSIGDDTFVVVEKWESLGALKDHVVSAHMATYADRTREFIESRIIHVLSPESG